MPLHNCAASRRLRRFAPPPSKEDERKSARKSVRQKEKTSKEEEEKKKVFTSQVSAGELVSMSEDDNTRMKNRLYGYDVVKSLSVYDNRCD